VFFIPSGRPFWLLEDPRNVADDTTATTKLGEKKVKKEKRKKRKGGKKPHVFAVTDHVSFQ
jgi:hypothetical protein